MVISIFLPLNILFITITRFPNDFTHNAYKMIYVPFIYFLNPIYFIFQKSRQLKTKRDEATESFKAGNLQDAFNHYSTALSIDPNNKTILAKMYCSRATVLAKVIFCHKYY